MKIRFDDYVKRYDDGECWSPICKSCVGKFNVPTELLDEDGQGTCGVKGCNNEADFYWDFILDLTKEVVTEDGTKELEVEV